MSSEKIKVVFTLLVLIILFPKELFSASDAFECNHEIAAPSAAAQLSELSRKLDEYFLASGKEPISESRRREILSRLDKYNCSISPDPKSAFRAAAKILWQIDPYQEQRDQTVTEGQDEQAKFDKFLSGTNYLLVECRQNSELQAKQNQTLAKHPEFAACQCPIPARQGYHFIECIKNNPEPRSYSIEEGFSLDRYTGSGFSQINTALRSGDAKSVCALMPIISNLVSMITKFPLYSQVLYRRADLPRSVLNKHHVGDAVEYSAFTSTTADFDIAKAYANGEGWLFTIHPHQSCFDIRSKNPYQAEVICAPGARFRIDSRDDEKREITLTEID